MSDDEYGNLVQYQSETSSDDNHIDLAASNIKSKTRHTWKYLRTFESTELAKGWIKSEGIWSLRNRYMSDNGKKEHYRCNKLRLRGPQCACAVYLHFPDENDTVIAYISEENHTHDQLLAGASCRGLTKATKEYVIQIVSKGVLLPKTIVKSIANEAKINNEIQLPKDFRQLYNFLNSNKRKTDGSMQRQEKHPVPEPVPETPLEPEPVHKPSPASELVPIPTGKSVRKPATESTRKPAIVPERQPMMTCGTKRKAQQDSVESVQTSKKNRNV